ncbi:MAG: methyltransferase [Clostridia bacterium]|nr:methyltransferase [Clostridia bacterium]
MSLPHLLPDERIDRVNEDLSLIQKKQGLTYGTDAFLLAAYIRPQPRGIAVELGSGTGIVSFLMASKNKAAGVYAVEIQESFAELIARNAEINGLNERVTPLCADLRELSPAQFGKEVDLVFSNPPYMKCDTGKRNLHDEKFIARHEVFGGIADFCACAGRLLRFGGRFVCVWRPDRLTELLAAMRDAALEPKRMTLVHADAQSEPCAVLIEAVKGGIPSLRVTPPLLLYQPREVGQSSRVLTPQAQDIYQHCIFSGIFDPDENRKPVRKEP